MVFSLTNIKSDFGSVRYGFVDLLRAADDFAKRNFVEMCLGEEFLSLEKSRLLQLVSSNELNVLVESKVTQRFVVVRFVLCYVIPLIG